MIDDAAAAAVGPRSALRTAAAVAAVVLVTAAPATAHADAAPGDAAAAAAAATTEPRPADAEDSTASRDTPCPAADAGGSSIVPDDCWGPFPSSHYDIGFDEGAWNHTSRKLYGTFTDLVFQGARTATTVALWMVEWGYGFGVYDRLGEPAVRISRSYERDVVGPLGLVHLAWFYAVAWAAVAGLRGRLAMAAGELVVSIVAAGLAAVMLANPAGYLQGAFDTMGRLSGSLLATGTGQPPPQNPAETHAVLAPLQAQLHAAFVDEPYDYLNWGGPLPAACAAARDELLARGPHGSDDEPRSVMAAAGCDTQAGFNHDPSGTRFFGAVFTFAAATATAVLVGLVAFTVVVAQVIAIVLLAVAPFALVAAILPGAGRELAWRWLTGLVRVVLAVLGMSLVLSLLLLTVTALLEASTGVGLVERFALVNVVVIAMAVARRRVLAAGHGLAGAFGHRLAARRAGGERAAPWLAAPAAAGATGFAVAASLGPDRSARSTRWASTGGRSYLASRRGRRQRRAADARAAEPSARQRTEITADGEGNPLARTVVTLDGPTATSRRARAARARLEHHAHRHVAAEARRHRVGWPQPAAPNASPNGKRPAAADRAAPGAS